MRIVRDSAFLVFLSAGGTVACGASGALEENAKAPSLPAPRPASTNIEIAELEVGSVDRFASCPPSGELGQGWIPPVPPFAPPSVAAAPLGTSAPPPAADGRSATEKAIHDDV